MFFADLFILQVQQELEVYLSIVEAQATLTYLLDDRANRQEDLDKLRSSEDVQSSQIQQLEEEIELRSVQISDLQQKILDFDEGSA